MAKLRSRPTLLLPWEHRSRWLQHTLTGSRVRIAVTISLIFVTILALFSLVQQHVRRRASRVAIDEVHRAIAAFRQDTHRCPVDVDELIKPPLPGRRYLQQAPRDGWGHPLYVRCPGRFDDDQPDVISAGPSGSFLVDDNMR